jgi:two-component system chemotaxis response regulator CheB
MAERESALAEPDVAPQGRVLVVDDSEIFVRTAAAIVSAAGGLHLVGTAASGEEAIRLLPELKPDLVLLDIHMPGLDGIETARIIHRDEPRTVVVIVSCEPAGASEAAWAAGAIALLDKRDLVPSTLDALWLEHAPDAGW